MSFELKETNSSLNLRRIPSYAKVNAFWKHNLKPYLFQGSLE